MSKHLHVVDGGEARSSSIDAMLQLLADTAERVKRGEVATILIFEDAAGSDEYAIHRSKAENYLEVIGKLEAAKHNIFEAAARRSERTPS